MSRSILLISGLSSIFSDLSIDELGAIASILGLLVAIAGFFARRQLESRNQASRGQAIPPGSTVREETASVAVAPDGQDESNTVTETKHLSEEQSVFEQFWDPFVDYDQALVVPLEDVSDRSFAIREPVHLSNEEKQGNLILLEGRSRTQLRDRSSRNRI